MEIFLITSIIFILSVVGMSVGAIFMNRPLKGSCGGLGSMKDLSCLFCTKRYDCKTHDSELEQVLNEDILKE